MLLCMTWNNTFSWPFHQFNKIHLHVCRTPSKFFCLTEKHSQKPFLDKSDVDSNWFFRIWRVRKNKEYWKWKKKLLFYYPTLTDKERRRKKNRGNRNSRRKMPSLSALLLWEGSKLDPIIISIMVLLITLIDWWSQCDDLSSFMQLNINLAHCRCFILLWRIQKMDVLLFNSIKYNIIFSLTWIIVHLEWNAILCFPSHLKISSVWKEWGEKWYV